MNWKRIKFRRVNNALHRDLGYLIAGAAVVYAVSGLAMNHIDDWNSNFIIDRQNVTLEKPIDRESASQEDILAVLQPLGEHGSYRGHDFPSREKLKIYLDDGSVFFDLKTGEGVYESLRRRPLFYSINCLHLSPKSVWLIFSDIFALALIIVSISGLFILKGRKGITGRGAILTTIGILIPLWFLLSV